MIPNVVGDLAKQKSLEFYESQYIASNEQKKTQAKQSTVNTVVILIFCPYECL